MVFLNYFSFSLVFRGFKGAKAPLRMRHLIKNQSFLKCVIGNGAKAPLRIIPFNTE